MRWCDLGGRGSPGKPYLPHGPAANTGPPIGPVDRDSDNQEEEEEGVSSNLHIF